MYLQDALFDRNRQRHTVCTCEPARAIYVPGDCCILQYDVEIEDRASGQKSLYLVNGRIFPNALASGAYLRDKLVPLIPLIAGREEMAPFATPVASIEPLHMAVYAFPIDAELPALAAATDPRRVASILDETLPDAIGSGREMQTWRVELVVYPKLDHQLDDSQARADMLRKTDAFLKASLKP